MNGIRQRLRQAMVLSDVNVHQIVEGDTAAENRISRQLNGSALTVETLMTILEGLPDNINLEWILYGRGNRLNPIYPSMQANNVNVTGSNNNVTNNGGYYANVSNPDDEITEADFEIVEKIPIVPAQLVKVPNLDVYEELSKRPQELKMVLRGSAYADLVARIKDMAMYPEFQPNDEVYLKVIDNWEHLINGSVYVVDTYSKGMLCRMLYDEGEYYAAKSRQDRYSEFKIPKDDIIKVYNITQLRRIPN